MNDTDSAVRTPDRVWPGILSMLVHDLRTPLSSVILNLELLGQSGDGLSAEQREDIEYALTGARTLAEMLKGVSDLAHFAGGDRKIDVAVVDLSKLVSAAAAGAETDPGAGTAVLIEAGSSIRAHCSAGITERVVRDMVAKAIAVTSGGQPVRVSITADGAKARIEVIDAGVTIPEELREGIFELAGALELRSHRRALSRGIGPTVWRLVARAQGGEAGTRPVQSSTPDRGNVFWLELPRTSG